jgi:hypothetical protein
MNRPEGVQLVKASIVSVDLVWPVADPDWHPIARDWYGSLEVSGQAQFYQPSDVATARYVAEAMSRNLASSRISGQLFGAVMSAMTELLTTEGARRRARVELERAESVVVPPEVAIMARYRKAAGVKSSA